MHCSCAYFVWSPPGHFATVKPPRGWPNSPRTMDQSKPVYTICDTRSPEFRQNECPCFQPRGCNSAFLAVTCLLCPVWFVSQRYRGSCLLGNAFLAFACLFCPFRPLSMWKFRPKNENGCKKRWSQMVVDMPLTGKEGNHAELSELTGDPVNQRTIEWNILIVYVANTKNKSNASRLSSEWKVVSKSTSGCFWFRRRDHDLSTADRKNIPCITHSVLLYIWSHACHWFP